jgi:ACS family tartrate transporter-like MFS transporter
MDGAGGLKGWQWLFLVEGIPSFLLGFVVLFYLTDRPEHAKWLTAEERDCLLSRIKKEEAHRERTHGVTLLKAFSHPRVILLAGVYFLIVVGSYGMGLWGPLILKSRSVWTDSQISYLWAIPSLLAAITMVIVGTHSDHTYERRWHLAGSAAMAAVGLSLSAALKSPVPTLLALSLASMGIASTLGPFWSMPTGFLSGAAAAGGIAFINSVGNLGGFAGPYLMGALKGSTSGFTTGLFVLAASLLCAGCLVFAVRQDPHPDDVAEEG